MSLLKKLFKPSTHDKTNAAGAEAFLDAGLTDMESCPENRNSKPTSKERREFLQGKGKAPYELKNS